MEPSDSHLCNLLSAAHEFVMQAQWKQIKFFWLYEILVASL